MRQVQLFDKRAKEYDRWFDSHPHVFQSELTALKMQLLKVGENVSGIEVGLGTGRFAEALGIKEGVEPAPALGNKAVRRGVEVIEGVAESLPYKALHFDFVLFVTIEHLENFQAALKEAYRVLKPGGSVIIGFIDKHSPIGTAYQQKRKKSHFYRHAQFYTAEKVADLLHETGFKNPDFTQTLFGKLEEIREPQSPEEGYGEGSFVVVKADKLRK